MFLFSISEFYLASDRNIHIVLLIFKHRNSIFFNLLFRLIFFLVIYHVCFPELSKVNTQLVFMPMFGDYNAEMSV